MTVISSIKAIAKSRVTVKFEKSVLRFFLISLFVLGYFFIRATPAKAISIQPGVAVMEAKKFSTPFWEKYFEDRKSVV